MILDFKDEILCENLNHVLSGLLPHQNYNPDNFGRLYPTLKSVLPMANVRGLYYALFVVLDKYYALQMAVNEDNFQVRITRERFEKALANNLPDLVLEPQLLVKELMNEEGKSGDISIPTIQNEAMGIVYEKSLALYDSCLELEQSYEDSMAYIIDLRDSIKANVIETGMQMQRAIVSVGMKYGRHFYRGTSGWVDFVKQLVREVSELDINSDDDLDCNSLEVLPKTEAHAVEISEALAGYGIPQLDDATPMLQHRLVILVARENTGKTKVITHWIASLIRAGVKPYFACGESQPPAIFMQIVSSYIYQEYGLYFTESDLTGEGYNSLTEEDKQIVQTAKARVAVSGVVISNSLEYDNVYATLTEKYRSGCRAFFIDHSQSLRGRRGRKIGDLVTSLALDCREFKNTFAAYVCITSHPSTNLKDMLQKDQTKDMHQSPTAQSSTPSQEADELFILNETDYLRKQNLLQWIVFKRRGAAVPPSFYIRKLFHVASYQYDPNVQGGDSLDNNELEGMISDMGSDAEAAFDDPDSISLDF